jgi:Protein of unknown function (DUF3606).
MADNKRKKKADGKRVAIEQPYERRYWCKRFKCTPRELVLARRLLESRGTALKPNSPDSYVYLFAGADLFLKGELATAYDVEQAVATLKTKARRRG